MATPVQSTTALDAFAVDGMKPTSAVQPDSVAEVARILKESMGAGQAIIPWGGGTRIHVGNLPERYTCALDLRKIPPEMDHVPGDMTLVASSSVTVGEIERQLARSGQRLAFDTPAAEMATIGGAVASNAAGFMRSSAGGIRDWVIGMQVVLPGGTITRSGGRVVKNVQGYDLHRLQVGAFGTLGIITEIAFKLVPVPAESRDLAVVFHSFDKAAAWATALFGGPFTPERAALFCGAGANKALEKLTGVSVRGPSYLALVRTSGGKAAVSRQVNETSRAAREAAAAAIIDLGVGDGSIWSMAAQHILEVTVSARASARHTGALGILSDVAHAEFNNPALSANARLDIGFGGVLTEFWTRDHESALEAIQMTMQSAERHGGSAMLERCPAGIKRGLDVFGRQGAGIGIMRSLKEQYDAERVLNPGRFAGGI